jgi:hypothetical protein
MGERGGNAGGGRREEEISRQDLIAGWIDDRLSIDCCALSAKEILYCISY